MINVQNFQLDVSVPAIKRLRLVNGDTANRFVITVTNNKAPVTLDTSLHKVIAVFTRADGQIYTQDASCGVSFTTGGVVTIDVRPASFRTGTNKITLQIYKRENSSATEYPLLLTTQEQPFNARSRAIPEAGAPNAPSQLPMLEGLIEDAREAISDCEDATDAANNAADAANEAAGVINTMIENIDDVPTQNSNNLVKSGGVYSAIPLGASANPLMDGVAAKGMSAKFAREDHVHPSDTSKQDVLTFDDTPTSGSNNPVKSGGIKAAIDAAVARVGVRYITPTTLTWDFAHTFATGTLGVTRSEIDALLDAGKFVGIYSGLDDSAVVMYPTQSDDMLYFSSLIDGGLYYSAEIYDNTITIQAHRINKNLVLVKHDADWVSDTSAHGATTLTATELRAMMPDSIFAIQVKGFNYDRDHSVITLIESFRDEASNIIYFRTSESVDKRMYVGAIDINGSGSTKGVVDVDILIDVSPLMLHVDEITIDDDDYITSISFVETNMRIFEAIGVRPLEVIVVNDSKNYHLREWVNWENTTDLRTPSQTVVSKYAELKVQDVNSEQYIFLRIIAQHSLGVYSVRGEGVITIRR